MSVKLLLLKSVMIPIFGICLGHQILARACDISTFKLHNGHRGINHPVKNLDSGKSEVTSQNHGFSVSLDDINNSKNLQLSIFYVVFI